MRHELALVRPDTLSSPLIAADVGGTYARLACVATEPGRAGPKLEHYRRYACAEYPGLAAILREYARDAGIGGPFQAAVAIAGLLVGDTLVHANLPWSVSVSATIEEAGLEALALINDFEALAWAVPTIDTARTTLVSGPDEAPPIGPSLVIGPGTGLGAAVWLPGPPAAVVATEAGHAALSVGTPRELDVLRQLMQRWSHVDNERLLSGPGLVNGYRALCELDDVAPAFEQPAEIATAAQEAGQPQATEALQMFCGLLGSLAGDLVLTFAARSVYLAGGIPTQIAPFLLESGFADRFVDKGVMRDVLARVPVRLVEHGQLGLQGAAMWYLQHNGVGAGAIRRPG
jgi:glucokinase